MVTLIMTNINYLVILICSTIFLLPSFVSSQQKLKYYKDPLELYNHARYLYNHHPEYYAKIYQKLREDYNSLILESEAKRKASERGNSINNGQLEKNIVPKSAGIEALTQVPNASPSPRNKTRVNNYRSTKTVLQPEGSKFSRSLNNIQGSKAEALKKVLRESSVARESGISLGEEWNQYCSSLGFNNTNNVCQSDPHEQINKAPDIEKCLKYFKVGCQYRSDQISCSAVVDEVIKNITFDCSGINIDKDIVSFECCLACKGGINTATTKDNCDMHSDSTIASLAQEFCCKKSLSLNAKESVTTTESIASSAKPESMDEIIAHLDERLSNSTTLKPEIDTPTISETSPLPTTTTTTITPTLSTATQAATLPTTEPPATTTTIATTTTTTTTAPTSATTEPTTPITGTAPTSTTTERSTTTSPTTTASPSPSTPTLSATTEEMSLSNRNLEARRLHYNHEKILEDYMLIDSENNVYEKMNVEDRSKPDYLVILDRTLKIENEGFYENFKLMNLTLRSNIKCDWKFNIEKIDAEPDVKTLSKYDFDEKPEKSSFILILDGQVEPQTIQYSVACNIKDYKYYKYIVYLAFQKS